VPIEKIALCGGYPSGMSEPDPMCYVLRDLRTRVGMTQKQLAAQLGVDRRTVLRWEDGENTPTLTDLRRLAAVFNVSVGLLIGEWVDPGTRRSV
jgi:transcriptional regulator with XRE-family HTH domain